MVRLLARGEESRLEEELYAGDPLTCRLALLPQRDVVLIGGRDRTRLRGGGGDVDPEGLVGCANSIERSCGCAKGSLPRLAAVLTLPGQRRLTNPAAQSVGGPCAGC